MYKFIVSGHVDHSKSSICGRILYDVKHYDQHMVDEIFRKAKDEGMERQRFSRLLDICEEEQKKGKTMDWTEINFKYNDKNYVLIDTPGHKLFLPQMIAGACPGLPGPTA
jgi:translation elongation factor EF-1alpha